jgi:acetyl-CoA synthetase
MSEVLYNVPGNWSTRAHVDAAKYHEMYAHSARDPESFWGEHGKRIDWIKPYTWVKRTSFAPGNVSIEWFGDGPYWLPSSAFMSR